MLTQPKNAVVKQYQAMFAIEGVKLEMTEEALTAIAQKALESSTGARALRMILENAMRDLMYEVPSDPSISEIVIEKETITENKLPLIKRAEKKIA